MMLMIYMAISGCIVNPIFVGESSCRYFLLEIIIGYKITMSIVVVFLLLYSSPFLMKKIILY